MAVADPAIAQRFYPDDPLTAEPPPYDDRPFVLEHDAIEVQYVGKSSGLYFWRDGRFQYVPLSD